VNSPADDADCEEDVDDRILVIGELNVDMIVGGLDTFPVLGQEVVAADLHMVLGSSSAICAAGLARLGAGVDFLGKVGGDQFGEFVTEELQRLGVGTKHVIHDDAVRTGITISLTYPEDRALVTYLGCIAHLHLADIQTSILTDYRHLHVGSYFLQTGLQSGLQDLFALARRAGLTVSLDTGWDPNQRWGNGDLLTLLESVDLFFPNEREACAIARVDDAGQAMQELGKRVGLVAVKRGPEGAMAIKGGQIVYSPGFRVNVVDATGAGDSFDAGFIFAYLVQHQPLAEALRFANACGALCATGYGGTAAQPTLHQVQDMLRSYQG
jgi:sugar/nucleoside kinase (ribokinase family)